MKKLLRDIALGLYSGGGLPAISVSPSSWDFGSTPVGSPVTKEFTIQNTGTTALEITLPITIVGDDADAFSVTDQPDETSLAPGESTMFTVQADADVVDVFDANISITNNSSENPKLVAVTVDVSAMLYSDEFTGTVAAPIPAGNADTRGYRVVNDAESLMTIGSGVLNVPAQVSAVWGDEYYRAQPSSGQQYWTRPAGKALVAVVDFRQSIRFQEVPVGWWTTATLNANARGILTLGTTINVIDNGNTVSDGQPHTINTDFPVVAVWDSTGFSVYAKIAGVWHLKWRKYEVVAQAYCGMSNFSSTGSLKYFRIYAIDESLFAPALSIAAPSVGNLSNMPDGDFLLYLDNITRPSTGDIHLYARKKDASNYWREKASDSVGSFAIAEVVVTTPTNRITASGVVSTDDEITIARGATIQAWRNTTALGSAYTSAYNFLREVQLELNSLGTGGAIGALYAWKARLLDTNGLGSELVVDGSMTSSVTNWPAVATPTTRQYTGGRLQIVADAANEGAEQTIAGLTVGNYYIVSMDYEVVSGSLLVLIASNGALRGLTGTGSLSFGFVATATSHTLRLLSDGGASEFYIDNATIKLQQFTADSLALVLDGLAA